MIQYFFRSKDYKEFQTYASKLDMIKLLQQASIGLNPNLAVGSINTSGSSSALLDQGSNFHLLISYSL